MPSAIVRALSVGTSSPRSTESFAAGAWGRDDTDHARVESERVAHGDDAADARAAADRHVDRVEIGDASGTARVHSSTPPAHELDVKGGTGNSSSLSAIRIASSRRLVEVVAELGQLGAEGAHRGVLLDRVAARHEDAGDEPRGRRRPRLALPVVAAGGGDDAARVRVLAPQPVDEGDPAAHLEGTGRGVVLVLDDDVRAGAGGERRPGVLRRGRHVRVDEAGGALERVFVEQGHRRVFSVGGGRGQGTTCPARGARDRAALLARSGQGQVVPGDGATPC